MPTASARRLLTTLLVALALLPGLGPRAADAQATPFVVTTTQDAPHTTPLDGNCTSTLTSNPCTLRAAIQAANALGGTQTIQLGVAGAYLLTVTGAGEQAAASGDLDLNGVSLTLTNTSGEAVAIDGNATDRVFDVGPTGAAQLTTESVAVRNGRVTGDGAGIRVGTGSSLTLSNVTLSGNAASGSVGGSGRGGGVANFGTATLNNVTLNGNSAAGGPGPSGIPTAFGGFGGPGGSASGGGILNAGTSLTLTNVTFSANTASGGSGGPGVTAIFGNGAHGGDGGSGRGGAVSNESGAVFLTNVTLSGNTASGGGGGPGGAGIAGNGGGQGGNGGSGSGGGLATSGAATLAYLTISGNAVTAGSGGPGGFGAVRGSDGSPGSASGGGLAVSGSTGAVTLQSSIVAGSIPAGINCAGTLTSQGDNLADDPSCFPASAALNDRVVPPTPLLGTLGNNGGFTPTIPPAPGSPAIDGVVHNPCPPPATDQRGYLRPAGARCDIGAFELNASSPTPTLSPTPTRTPTVTPLPTQTATPTTTSTQTSTPSPTTTTTPTATGTTQRTPTTTATPIIVPAVPAPPASGQAGVPCATQPGQTCTVSGGATGTWTHSGSGAFRLSATGPATAAPGGTPRVFLPTTAGVETFPCTPLGAAAPFTATCVGLTVGNLLQGATVTVRFPLAGGGTLDVTGVVTGPGAPVPAIPAAPAAAAAPARVVAAPLGGVPPLVPPLLPPPPPPFLLPPAPAPAGPPAAAGTPSGVPVVPEAETATLVLAGLAALGLLAARRR